MMRNKRALFSVPYIVWVLGFTIIPLFVIVGYAFTTRDGSFTLSNVVAIFQGANLKALINSFIMSAICTLICLLMAYPLALILARMNKGANKLIIMIFVLPMWMNFILRVMALQLILSENGILNLALGFIGIEPLHIINTPVAIVIGMVYDFFPFMILPIYNSIVSIDHDVIEAAQDLGAGGMTVFRRIIFPLSLQGMFSGITMVLIPAMTSFVISNILGGGKIQLIGNVIEYTFGKGMQWNLGSGLSLVLMLFILISSLFNRGETDASRGAELW